MSWSHDRWAPTLITSQRPRRIRNFSANRLWGGGEAQNRQYFGKYTEFLSVPIFFVNNVWRKGDEPHWQTFKFAFKPVSRIVMGLWGDYDPRMTKAKVKHFNSWVPILGLNSSPWWRINEGSAVLWCEQHSISGAFESKMERHGLPKKARPPGMKWRHSISVLLDSKSVWNLCVLHVCNLD